ncbi:hypothetical protein N1851_017239 [Merluccius polli]|uniref:DUF4218 domain-containing protein n=1 Tax=Merluccius polli TaxID=89951 RepID=A0AA47NZ80_MERPO|nr:hypothetical protein N1851_017239 [Merluccius polli]
MIFQESQYTDMDGDNCFAYSLQLTMMHHCSQQQENVLTNGSAAEDDVVDIGEHQTMQGPWAERPNPNPSQNGSAAEYDVVDIGEHQTMQGPWAERPNLNPSQNGSAAEDNVVDIGQHQTMQGPLAERPNPNPSQNGSAAEDDVVDIGQHQTMQGPSAERPNPNLSQIPQTISMVVYHLLQERIRDAEVVIAEQALNKFVREFQGLYGTANVSFNVHLMTHLAASVRNWGPLWATSTFSFESFNGTLLTYFNGTTHVPVQIMKRYLREKSLTKKGATVMQNANEDVKDLFSELQGRKCSSDKSVQISAHSKCILSCYWKGLFQACRHSKMGQIFEFTEMRLQFVEGCTFSNPVQTTGGVTASKNTPAHLRIIALATALVVGRCGAWLVELGTHETHLVLIIVWTPLLGRL